MDLYAENILEHYRNPLNHFDIRNSTFDISHSETNHSCGDELTIGINIEDGSIKEIQWDGTGCAISQAAMSMLSEKLQGMKIENAEKLTKDDVFELLGVPIGPRRMKCALLGLSAIQNALNKK